MPAEQMPLHTYTPTLCLASPRTYSKFVRPDTCPYTGVYEDTETATRRMYEPMYVQIGLSETMYGYAGYVEKKLGYISRDG